MSSTPPPPVVATLDELALEPARPFTPSPVGPYELLLELASGGMATVFLARARDGRAVAPLVAIKRPHRHLVTDKNYIAMLLDEARLASSIAHENVVKVRELRFDDGEPSIVMDYVEGASLSELRKELVAAERAFDLKVALRIAKDALAGLHAAHELADAAGQPLGIVHRDVSPHNILVGTDGRARLTDFGVAHAGGRFQETRTAEVKGKLAYLAPERVDRRRICTRQSDVFAMAIVLWECIAGRRLFRGDEAVDTLQEVMHLPIPRLRQIGCDVPVPLDEVIARGLSRDLDQRFPTALAFATALEKAAIPGSIGAAEHVAALVEAICGARLAERHERVRAVLADDAVTEKLFDDAGLARRLEGPEPHPIPAPVALDTVAPLAPSERYAFGIAELRLGALAERPTRWALVVGVAAGLILGVGGTIAVAMRRASVAPSPVASAPARAVVAPDQAPSRVRSAWVTVPPPEHRGVTVRLPFLASHVSIDGVARDIVPAADVVPLDIAAHDGARHHVVVTAIEGTTLEADAVEVSGIAIVRGAVDPTSPPGGASPPTPARVGVTRNGFTRLR